MSKTRVVPHRVSRDERKAHEIADLKKENNFLKRTVTRLRKEVAKRVQIEADVQEEAETVTKREYEAKVTVSQCPKCEVGNIRVVELGERVFHICENCKDRRRVNGISNQNV